jgi:hypothetical protein
MPVRARRAKKSSPIRYLLLADQKLQRISLKKISARFRRAKPQSRSKSPANGKTAERLRTPGAAGTAMLLVGACVVGAAALIAARQPSAPTEARTADVPLMEIGQQTPRQSSGQTPRPVSGQVGAQRASMSKMPAPAEKTAVRTAAAESRELPTVSNVQALAPVTITGCLEMARGSFRLKNTSGTDAPRSRSWKSGFLRKRSSQIEVVDDANALKLPAYVGQRVVATGTLANGEMRARSVKRISASCE